MSFYELEHGYYLYMCDWEERGYICKNACDIYKVSNNEIKGIKYIKINRAEYPIVDAILRGDDTDGIKYAIAESRSHRREDLDKSIAVYWSEDLDKSIDEIYESLPDNAISNPLGRLRNRLGDKFGIDSKLLEEIIPKKPEHNRYSIPATRLDMATMEKYKERHEPYAGQNHDQVSGNNGPVRGFPETDSYSSADLRQINGDRLYDRLFSVFENDRKNHPSIRMMDPDPLLFPKGLPEILSDRRLAVEEEEAPRAVRDMILDSWNREERQHILLIGEGGIGKTVVMLTLPEEGWFKKLGIPVIYVPLQRLDIYEGDLNRYIKEKIGSDNYERCIESANRTAKEHPNLLLLLDGFNEIPDRFKQKAEKSIREWMVRPGLQIITTSRLGFFLENSFLKYRLQPLPYDTVRSFLRSAGIVEEQLPLKRDRLWEVINVPLMLAMYTRIEKVKKTADGSSAAPILEWKEPDNAAHIIWNYLQMELYRCIEKCIGKDDSNYSVMQYAAAILAVAPYVCCQMSRLNKFYIKRARFHELIQGALVFYTDHQDMLGRQILKLRQKYDPYRKEDLFREGNMEGYARILIDNVALFQEQEICGEGPGDEDDIDYIYSLMHQNFRDALAAFFICAGMPKACSAEEKKALLDQADHCVKDYMAEHLSDRELVAIWERHRKEEPEDGSITFILMDLIGRQRNYDYRELDFSGLDLTRTNLHRLLSRRIDICPLPGDRNRLSNTKISVDCLCPNGQEVMACGVAFSPDGKLLASGGDNVRVWNLEDGNCRVFEGNEGVVRSVTFSPDGRQLASGADKRTARIWDIESGKSRVLKGHENEGETETLCASESVAFSPDGRLFASALGDRNVMIWDLKNEESRMLEGHESMVVSVAFSPDGKFLASGAGDGTVRIWSLESGENHLLEGYEQEAQSVAFSPDGRQLASCSWDGTIRLWNLKSGVSRVLKGHENEGKTVTLCAGGNVAFSPDGRFLASGGSNGTIRIWDIESGDSRILRDFAYRFIDGIAFSPNGRQIAAATSFSNTVLIWDIESGECRTIEGQTVQLSKLTFSPDGRHLAGMAGDRTIRIWTIESGDSRVLEVQEGGVFSIAFSPDKRHLISSTSNAVRIWDIESGKNRVLKRYKEVYWGSSAAFSSDGQLLAFGVDDGAICVLELKEGKSHMLKGHESKVHSVAFSPDGKFLASGANDGEIRIWELKGGKSHVLRAHTSQVLSVAFSPDGRQLASCSWDGTLRLWSLKSGENCILKEPGLSVQEIAFSPDGQILAGCASYGVIVIWDLETGKSCLLRGHMGMALSISFSPDGRLLASSGKYGTLRIWNLEKSQDEGKFIIIPHLNLSGANFERAVIDEEDKIGLRGAGARI